MNFSKKNYLKRCTESKTVATKKYYVFAFLKVMKPQRKKTEA